MEEFNKEVNNNKNKDILNILDPQRNINAAREVPVDNGQSYSEMSNEFKDILNSPDSRESLSQKNIDNYNDGNISKQDAVTQARMIDTANMMKWAAAKVESESPIGQVKDQQLRECIENMDPKLAKLLLMESLDQNDQNENNAQFRTREKAMWQVKQLLASGQFGDFDASKTSLITHLEQCANKILEDKFNKIDGQKISKEDQVGFKERHLNAIGKRYDERADQKYSQSFNLGNLQSKTDNKKKSIMQSKKQ
jgi:hypothetical protein